MTYQDHSVEQPYGNDSSIRGWGPMGIIIGIILTLSGLGWVIEKAERVGQQELLKTHTCTLKPVEENRMTIRVKP